MCSPYVTMFLCGSNYFKPISTNKLAATSIFILFHPKTNAIQLPRFCDLPAGSVPHLLVRNAAEPAFTECIYRRSELCLLWLVGLALSLPSSFHVAGRLFCRPGPAQGTKAETKKIIAHPKPCL